MALQVREYLTADGRNPFRDWTNRLHGPAKARILARVLRFEAGNFGDHKSASEGVCEARVFFGTGYRIYFGRDGDSLVLLLTGGDKSTQSQDILRARTYWRGYLEAKRHGKTKY